jgi:hypothetical protein
MIIKFLLEKDREFVSNYLDIDTKEMTDEEVENKLDEIIKEIDNERQN